MKKLFTMLFALGMVMALSGCAESEEMKEAKSAFNTEASRVSSQGDALKSAIESAEETLLDEGRPLDDSVIPALEAAIAEAKTVDIERPSMPMGLEAIQAETTRLAEVDYASDVEALVESQVAVENSREQRRLVTAPAEDFILERLGRVGDIDGVAAVTEDNDPNGNLNKPGGYTAQVFFTSPLVDQSRAYGATVIEKGTSGGGSIEVYATEEEAEKRNDYLASFDGSILASGTHQVVGTVIVRVSNEMTASQQKALESSIINALTAL